MTNLEITRLCAEAMGFAEIAIGDRHGRDVKHADLLWVSNHVGHDPHVYAPLHSDAQAMALVKKFHLTIQREHHGDKWMVGKPHPESMDADINRAICECVAKMQAAK